MTLPFFAALLLTSQAPHATPERVPSFSNLPSVRGEAAVSMDCEGSAPFEHLRCSFALVEVERPPALDLPQFADLVEAYYKDRLDSDQCASLAAMPDPPPNAPAPSPAKAAWLERKRGALRAACECRGQSCMASALKDLSAIEAGGCSVQSHSFSVEMKKVPGKQKWIGGPTPYPVCALEETHELERDGDTGWRYTRTYRTRGALPAGCEPVESFLSHPRVFSSGAKPRSLLQCEWVEFGPYWVGFLRGDGVGGVPSNEALHQSER